MLEESKLLEKLPLKQHLHNIRRVLKLLMSLDQSYIPWNMVAVLLSTALSYGGTALHCLALRFCSSYE